MHQAKRHLIAAVVALSLITLLVVGGVSGSTGRSAAAQVSAPEALRTPLELIQDAVRGDATSRDTERAALLLRASAAVENHAVALEAEQVATASRQIVLQQKAEAARERKLAAARALRAKIVKLGYDPRTKDPRTLAKQILKNRYGYGAGQFRCFDNIIMRESLWLVRATNPSSGAYGIPQALPGSKMASVAADWRTNPATQIIWGVEYMKDRYGSPCGAWGFKSGHGWY